MVVVECACVVVWIEMFFYFSILLAPTMAAMCNYYTTWIFIFFPRFFSVFSIKLWFFFDLNDYTIVLDALLLHFTRGFIRNFHQMSQKSGETQLQIFCFLLDFHTKQTRLFSKWLISLKQNFPGIQFLILPELYCIPEITISNKHSQN